MTDPQTPPPTLPTPASRLTRARSLLARAAWTLGVLAALVLAVGALLVAVGADPRHAVVRLLLDAADLADVGVFSPTDGVLHGRVGGSPERETLVGWGAGSVAWLVAGGLVDRLVRPRPRAAPAVPGDGGPGGVSSL